MGRRWSMRAMTLLSAGALGVHELRYLAAYGGDAARALDHQGHAYLALATPLVGGLLAVVLARVLVGVAVGRACDGALVRLGRTWAVAAACLLAVYTTQELVEGVLAPGHPAGVGGVFGHGGWLAMPLAVLVGAVVAVAMRVVRLVEARAGRRGMPLVWLLRAEPRVRLVAAAMSPPAGVLAEHRAGRAPPPVLRSA